MGVLAPEAVLWGQRRGSHFAGEGTEAPSGLAYHCLSFPDGPGVCLPGKGSSATPTLFPASGCSACSSLAWKSSALSAPLLSPPPILSRLQGPVLVTSLSVSHFSYLPASLRGTPPPAFQRAKLRSMRAVFCTSFLSQVPSVVFEQLSSTLYSTI